jgi:threonine dehydrogenase-like Zn-dependent dehydrogenase
MLRGTTTGGAMIQELVCTAPRELAWRQSPDPVPGAGEVLVCALHGAEKHGTMQAFYQGYGNARGRWDGAAGMHRPGEGMSWAWPIPLGNMIAGTVAAVGAGVEGFAIGDSVFGYGSFKALTLLPAARCWRLPAHVPWQTAMCLDPALFALAAVRDGKVRVGDVVAVFGLGAIGLLTVQMARIAGATVIAIDPVARRRELATGFGAAHVIDPAAEGADPGARLRELSAGRGCDVCIDFSGSHRALQAALRGVAFGGTVVAGAFPAPYPAGIDFGGEAHMNRPDLVFSRGCSDPSRDLPRWNEQRLERTCLDLINAGRLDGVPIISPVIPAADLLDHYPRIAADLHANVKLGVTF